MENLITPFKGAVIAAITHALIQAVPTFQDSQAAYVADAAWVALTAAISYAVPRDFGSGVSAWLLARFLKIRR